MDLYDHLSSLTADEVNDLAVKCETTPLYLWSLARALRRGDEKRYPQPKLAALLERHTNKLVQRWDCRPLDWSVCWPELVGTPGAPDVAGAEVSHG